MAEFDSADLLQKLKNELRRPTNDAQVVDTDLYDLLTEGCRHVQVLMAAHGMEQNALWEQATTSDTKTYTITGTPQAILEVRDGRAGPLQRLGPDSDPNTNLVWQGTSFLVPNDQTRVYANGLWVRYTPLHVQISASVAPTLLPARARYLAVFKAAELWMDRGGYRDATVFSNKFGRMAWGDPSIPGDQGLIGAMKQPFVITTSNSPDWWRSGDLRR